MEKNIVRAMSPIMAMSSTYLEETSIFQVASSGRDLIASNRICYKILGKAGNNENKHALK